MFGYIPTINDIKQDRISVNLNSYIVWTFTSFIGFLYALIVVQNYLLMAITSLTFILCFYILHLTLEKTNRVFRIKKSIKN